MSLNDLTYEQLFFFFIFIRESFLYTNIYFITLVICSCAGWLVSLFCCLLSQQNNEKNIMLVGAYSVVGVILSLIIDYSAIKFV